MTCPLPLRLPLFLLALAMPMVGCAGNDSPHLVATTGSSQKSTQLPGNDAPQDCDGLASLVDKRACYGKQDQASIDGCERTHPMRCKSYREMHGAERQLAEVEQSSIASVRKAYASYADGDAAYLDDLDAAAREANRAWRAYREAQCALEPFAQGMSRDLSEHLAEVCRIRMTRARIDEIKGFHTDADPSRSAGNGH
jgi:uncharacterized protein YecT (DUF1311 family)